MNGAAPGVFQRLHDLPYVLSLLLFIIKTAKLAGNFFFIAICRLQRYSQTVTLDFFRAVAGFAPKSVQPSEAAGPSRLQRDDIREEHIAGVGITDSRPSVQ
jgi:hypothetical protein